MVLRPCGAFLFCRELFTIRLPYLPSKRLTKAYEKYIIYNYNAVLWVDLFFDIKTAFFYGKRGILWEKDSQNSSESSALER